ncbi:aquaporin-5 [Periconia macrospinosa]|uniref:Aquaporin-5 n=1 Tax=Periconia macrospinosa TaxID=97972 RepID=A0A2V1DG86_9PLEO|nr:aquaporin-5 [Periconia macrospinosa]
MSAPGKLANILPSHKSDITSEGPTSPTQLSHTTGNHSDSSPLLRRPKTVSVRNEILAAAAEFIGTFMFLFFAFGGTQVANASTAGQPDFPPPPPNTTVLLYISLIFGFSLLVNVWIFFRVSGGLLNPAVTLGLFLIGAVNPLRAALCVVAQILAGICAAAVVSAILPGPLKVSTTLVGGMSIARGLFLEMFLTSLLMFTVFMLAAEKHKATFMAPIGIGLAFFVTQLLGVYYTGGSLNPARSFGPCVVTRSFPGYHYIYWIGPIMGSLLAWGVYKLVKLVDYQTINPGQDFDDHETALFHSSSHSHNAAESERPNVVAIVAEHAVRLASREPRESRFEEQLNGTEGTSFGEGRA